MIKSMIAILGCCMVAAAVCGQIVRDGPGANGGRAVRSLQAVPAQPAPAMSDAGAAAWADANRIAHEADWASRVAYRAAVSNLLAAAGVRLAGRVQWATTAERQAAARVLHEMAAEWRKRK